MKTEMQVTGGNPIIKSAFTADPTVLVHNNTLYLYTGHDSPPEGVDDYVMNDWLCFSTENLKHWSNHGSPLKAVDFAWASGDAYASKVINKNDRFYWFTSVSHGTFPGKAIGVAVADQPTGPFRDAKGSALITHTMLPPTDNLKANLDPTVLIDDDGQAYIFWGNQTCYFAKLKSNMIELDDPITTIQLPQFSEGAHVHKHNNLYYLCYGYGMPEKVGYAISNNINGPWAFKGIINEVVYNCDTNRPAIIEYKGNHYFFYHNGALAGGGNHRRSVCVEHLFYEENGSIRPVVMTATGISEI